jgi:chemotaxis protein methyltransferase CheR
MDQRERFTGDQDLCHLSPEGFARFARYITNELGIKMPDTKASMIQSRLVRRVRELGMHSLDQYGEYLFSTKCADELDHFVNAITTHKTDFFREPEHFTYLTEKAIPSLLGKRDGRVQRIHIWSAACSSGEEPYTLAMALSEYARCDYAILATDISSKVLERAHQAIYAEAQTKPIPLALKRKYFLQSKNVTSGLLRIIPELRERVSFHRLNLMDEDYCVKDHFDIIFLRNVLIYFDRDVQKAVIGRLCRYLKPGGYLFVGHSESLVDMDIPVTRVEASVYRMSS